MTKPESGHDWYRVFIVLRNFSHTLQMLKSKCCYHASEDVSVTELNTAIFHLAIGATLLKHLSRDS